MSQDVELHKDYNMILCRGLLDVADYCLYLVALPDVDFSIFDGMSWLMEFRARNSGSSTPLRVATSDWADLARV